VHRAAVAPLRPSTRTSRAADLVCEAAAIQFIRGVDEPTVPEVRLTRSRSGTNGSAMFIFENPSIFQASSGLGDITGLFMVDDEVGEQSTCHHACNPGACNWLQLIAHSLHSILFRL
jgi:hypothetical protein